MKAIMLLAEGFDEIEAFTPLNVLRRVNVTVATASLSTSIVTGKHSIKSIADKRLDEMDPYVYDMLILPSSQNLLNSARALDLAKKFNEKRKMIAAINTSAIILAKAGLLDDKIATIFPGYEKHIPRVRDAKVVVARNIITARGPASALDFSMKLAEILAGKPAMNKLKRSLAIDA